MSHVVPGEIIAPESGSLRGHGTRPKDGNLVSSVCGVVQRVNRLVTVQPLKGRFFGEIGDVLIGQIVEVNHAKRLWKVDTNGRHDAILQLSAIILPGAVQRKRTVEDSLSMRSFYAEDDFLSAEVQTVRGDGVLVLRTRSTRYGKLEGGIVVVVHHSLIRRQKAHFSRLPCGVEVIIGLNGYIWITEAGPEDEDRASSMRWMEQDVVPKKEITAQGREQMARVRNCLLLLNSLFLSIYPTSISAAVDECDRLRIETKNILSSSELAQILKTKRT